MKINRRPELVGQGAFGSPSPAACPRAVRAAPVHIPENSNRRMKWRKALQIFCLWKQVEREPWHCHTVLSDKGTTWIKESMATLQQEAGKQSAIQAVEGKGFKCRSKAPMGRKTCWCVNRLVPQHWL